MNDQSGPEDMRERATSVLMSPWTPIAAAGLFVAAILIAVVSVLLGNRTDNSQDALTEVIRAARSGSHVQASQLALSLSKPPEGLPKLLQWFYFVDNNTPLEDIDPGELDAFLTANQHWPGTRTMELKRERLLALERTPAEMLEYYPFLFLVPFGGAQI